MAASRVTMPQLVKALAITRATAERLVAQYPDCVGEVERFGIVRSWPLEAVEALRVVLAEERRLREAR